MKVFISRPIPKVGIDMLKAKGWDVVVNEKAEGRAATKAELIEGAKSSDAILAVLTDKIDG